MSDRYGLAIAIFGAIATLFAAVATWRAPTSAAKLAEALRRAGERHNERQRRKLQLFATLMQARARIGSDEGVQALNLIDVVFSDSRDVREAWAELYMAFEMKPFVEHVMTERLRNLLSAMAKDVGLADDIRADDLGRVYYPVVQAQDQFIRDMQRQTLWTTLQGQTAAGAAASASQSTPWPPKP